MRLGAIGYALGTWMLQRQSGLPGNAALALIALAAIALLLLSRSPRAVRQGERGSGGALRLYGGLLRRAAQLSACALLGFFWAALWAHTRLADHLDPSWEGRDIRLTGVIAAMPQPFERGLRFTFDVERAPAGAQVPRRVLLAWYTGMARLQLQEALPVRAGERWQLVARLKRPHGLVNPAGFDYEAWLLERGIRATGTVRIGRRSPAPQRVEAMVYRPGTIVERARERLRERLRRDLAGARYAGILAALAIGDRRAIEQQDWNVFTRTGTNHLMSISGLHVTMVSGLAGLLVLFGWRRVPPLALRFPAQKAAALAGLAAAFAYCLVSGFAVPAQRTLYMVAAVALSLLCDRSSSASRVLALALFAVLVFDPWAVLAPGFWLSFGAVALIFYAGARRGRRHWLLRWGAMQWAVTVGLAPVLLVLFGRVSLAAPLANAVAIPVISLIVTPLALVGSVLSVAFALQLAHLALEGLMPMLQWLAALKGAVWVQHAPAAWTLPLAGLGVLWLLLPRGVPARWVGALLFLPLVGAGPAPPAHGVAAVTVFDVGQGLSVLVRTRSHALLYDAGPSWATGADSGQRVILPVLRARGVRELDAMVISHDDTDHAGGALSVMRSVPAALLYSPLPGFDPIVLAAPYRVPCAEGRHWSWDGVRFEFLHPPMARYAEPHRSGNDMSCVLKVSTAQGAVLLTGDLDARSELGLVARHAGELAAQVLVVPHHGSSSSSTPEFVRRVAPQIAVFSVGYLNRFAHPRPEILERYRRRGSRIERTDRSGAIAIGIGERRLSVGSQRLLAPRYWYGH